MTSSRRIEVPARASGDRLDSFLAAELGLSRGYVRRLLSRGHVQLGPREAVKGDLLRGGDVITIAAFQHPDDGVLATTLGLEVLKRSADFIAVDKPAGLASQPLDYEPGDTAVSRILALEPGLRGIGSALECGLVHRLDVFTSGVLVFARSQEAWEAARLAFGERRVEKRYRARIHGALKRPERVSLRVEQRGERVRVVAEGGLPVELEVAPVEGTHDDDTSLVDVVPSTGAMHQIRIALAQLGHPIVGDRVYGSSPANEPRHWLHATSIRLLGFAAEAPLPPELRQSM